MKTSLICLTSLMFATAAAPVAGSDNLRAAQALNARGNLPIVVELQQARALPDHRLAMSFRVWSSTQLMALVGIPAGYDGWRAHVADSSVGTGKVKAPSVAPGARSRFAARYSEPVTIPVVFDRPVARGERVSADIVMLECDAYPCSPLTFSFHDVQVD